jgi:hypothetical protein
VAVINLVTGPQVENCFSAAELLNSRRVGIWRSLEARRTILENPEERIVAPVKRCLERGR